MKTFYFLLLTFAFSSCLTVDKIQRNCGKFTKICVTAVETETITRDTTIYRHDTIFIQLPASNIKITDTIYIEKNQAVLKPVHKEVGLIWVDAWINNNWLNIAAGLTDSTILVPVHDTLFLPDIFSQTTTTNTVTVKEKYIPKFYNFCFWFVIIQILLIIGFIVIKFGTLKYKLLKLK